MANEKLDYIRGIIYDAIAQLIPSLGKDFTLDVIVGKLGATTVQIKGITEIGKDFETWCVLELSKAAKKIYQERRSQVTGFTDVDLTLKSIVYEALTDLLPQEGRDFSLDIRMTNNKPNLSMKGHTQIGLAFAKYCTKHLQQQIDEVMDARYGREQKRFDRVFGAARCRRKG